jgi:hypothetical protein
MRHPRPSLSGLNPTKLAHFCTATVASADTARTVPWECDQAMLSTSLTETSPSDAAQDVLPPVVDEPTTSHDAALTESEPATSVADEAAPELAGDSTTQSADMVASPGQVEPALTETTETQPDSAPQPREPSRLARLFSNRSKVLYTLTTVTSVMLVLTVLATLAIGYPQLRTRASEVQMSPVSVVFDWPPLAGQKTSKPRKPSDPPQTWVNVELRSELAKLALTILSDDPLDVRTLERCRTALLATGWFQDDLRLIRDENNSVHVKATWRVPVAAVRIDNMDQLVSAKGELLSPRYAAGASGLKTIVGVTSRPPELGQAWSGGEVQAALRLIQELAELPGFSQVASVDASEMLAHKNLIIVTDRGNRIHWGGEPDQFTPGQPSTTTKLARLDTVFRRFGRIDAGRALLDVRVIDGVYVHDTEGVMSAVTTQDAAAGNDHR